MIYPKLPYFEPKTFSEFGNKRVDEYFELRNIKENPEIKRLLEEENQVTNNFLSDTSTLRETLLNELKAREVESYETAPYKHGPYEYFEKYEAGLEYAIHCRRCLKSQKVEVCLDENILAQGHSYFCLGFFEVSTDHKILAYAVDTDGSEQYTMKFLNLETFEHYPDEIKNISSSVCWFKDSYDIIYILQDETQRPYLAKVHSLGKQDDREIYHEKSAEFYVNVVESSDHNYIFLSCDGSITTEFYYMKGNDPSDDLKLIQERKKGHEYYVEYKDNQFYIITNDQHPNFRVAKTSVDQPQMIFWKDFIPASDERYINDFNCFKEFFVYNFKENGLNKIQIIKNDGVVHTIDFPENAYYVGAGDNAEYDIDYFRYDYYSLTTPLTVYDYFIDSNKSKLVYRKNVPTFNPELYVVERRQVKTSDNKEVPMSIFYRKDTKCDGSAPSLIYGYGAYGSCIEPWFDKKVLSLVDRGFVYAIAHIRGSSTLGRKWYEDGKFLKKKNTFQDFIDCSQFLVDEKYTNFGNIAIQGGSAGGLLIGAVLNSAPAGLYKVAHADVPFVDVLNTMLDNSLPLTELEYDEWGNPNDEDYFNYIKSYCPYQNIERKDYPLILATAGLNDPRVPYWEAMKWIYKLRELATDSNPKLLYTNMDSGHSGASGRFEYLKEDAMIYSFLLKAFDISE